MKIIFVSLLLGLAACQAVPEASSPKPFSPSLTVQDISYVLSSVVHFTESSGHHDKASAKSFILERGGLKNTPLILQLPDQSLIGIFISKKNEIAISGYTDFETNHWLEISKENNEFRFRDAELKGGLGCGSELLVSPVSTKVVDNGVLCVDAF